MTHPRSVLGEINKYGFRDDEKYVFKSGKGSTRRSSARSRR